MMFKSERSFSSLDRNTDTVALGEQGLLHMHRHIQNALFL